MVRRDEVYRVIDEKGPLSMEEIGEETFQGKRLCGECGRETNDWDEHMSKVGEHVRQLVDWNYVISTADWNYDTRDDVDYFEEEGKDGFIRKAFNSLSPT